MKAFTSKTTQTQIVLMQWYRHGENGGSIEQRKIWMQSLHRNLGIGNDCMNRYPIPITKAENFWDSG